MRFASGMTELVLNTKLTPQQREDLRTVKDSADSLLTVIDDILDFSKIESGKLEFERTAFELEETLAGAMRVSSFRAQEKGLELICDVDSIVPARVVGDSVRLRQVIVSLVGNAVKFTSRGEVAREAPARCYNRSERKGGIGNCAGSGCRSSAHGRGDAGDGWVDGNSISLRDYS